MRRFRYWSLALALFAFAELWVWCCVRCLLIGLNDLALYTLAIAVVTFILANVGKEEKKEEKEGW